VLPIVSHLLRALLTTGLAATLAAAFPARASDPTPLLNSLTTTERLDHQRENRALVDLLQNLHYTDQQFRDVAANDMIDAFASQLDSAHLVFTEEDIKHWHQRFGRTLKGVYLVRGEEQPMFEIADQFRAAVAARSAWIDAKLAAGLDLSVADTPVGHDVGPAHDAAELDRRWEKELKAALLRQRLLGRDAADATKTVRERYQDFREEIDRLNATRVREAFWEALLGLFDPHSGYFAADTADEFGVMMRGGVSGIGLTLSKRHGRTVVGSVQPGSPADENGELQSGDEIVAFKSSDGSRTETADLTSRQATALLRGEAGTTVQVFFRRGADGPVRDLTLTRRDLVLIHDRARGARVTVQTDHGDLVIGWIHLPDFYHDGQDKATSSAADDVRQLVVQLTAAGAKAFVLDLRGDPGGAIVEAVGLAGIFIPTGTVVITRGSDLKTKRQSVDKPAVATDLPLLVLVSKRSASASELFAGAMQFHRRAIVIGEERTFGKGTAQAYIDLNRLSLHPANAGRWGTLRVTSEKFYFPDGRSAQGTGARSDLVLPSVESDEDFEYEEQQPHALPADKLGGPPPARASGSFPVVDAELIRQLQAKLDARRATDPEFRLGANRLAFEKRLVEENDKTLRLEDAMTADRSLLVTREALRQETLALPRTVRSEPVEIALVREAKTKHEAWSRARRPADADGHVGWVARGAFHFEDGETLREVWLGSLPFRERAADPSLVTAFNRASGKSLSAPDVEAALRRLALLETYYDGDVAKCFGTAEPDAPAWRGIEAVLHELAVGEASTFSRFNHDVTARETLWTAADWIGLNDVGRDR
jgi:carboxyl-terminal processing protease